MQSIPYGKHYIGKGDFKSVAQSLKSDKISDGKIVKSFEKKLRIFLNTKYVLVTSSGTAGLHLALLSINVKKKDVIIMPSINFVAAYNMATTLGAKVYLADVDKMTGQMTPQTVEKCIKEKKLKRIKCIINMYLGGSPENITEFYNIKKKYKCFLIEDACHALGSYSKINNKKVEIGSNKNSDISIFSFHPVKAIATGEGGCITTRSKKIFYQASKFKNHGIVRSSNHWNYDVLYNGYNYRLSDINSALGISQLKNINSFLKKRNKIATLYKKEFKNLEPYLTLPNYDKSSYNSYHLFVISINFQKLKKNKNTFFKHMLKKKIVCQLHYKPIYRFKIFKDKISLNKFTNSEYYFNSAISLPNYYDLKLKEQKFIIKKVKSFILKNIK